jgi:hypothetical protein
VIEVTAAPYRRAGTHSGVLSPEQPTRVDITTRTRGSQLGGQHSTAQHCFDQRRTDSATGLTDDDQ